VTSAPAAAGPLAGDVAAPHHPQRRDPSRRRLVWLAGACTAAALAVYLLALGVDVFRDLDRDLRYPQIVGDWRVRDDASDEFGRVATVGFTAWGAALAVLAIAAGRLRGAVLAGGAVGLGALATWITSEGLGRLDPVGGEMLRYAIDGGGVRTPAPGAFPSGHAAVAMALAVGTVLVLPPRLRPLGIALTAPPVAAVCVAIMALGWHYPSDILGAVLLSTAAGAAVAAIPAGRPERGRPASGRMTALGAAVACLACAGAGAWGLRTLPAESAGRFVEAHPAFIAFCVVTVLGTVGCLVALSVAFNTRSASQNTGADRPGLTPGDPIG